MLHAISGGVSCRHGVGEATERTSNFGCPDSSEIAIFVTEGKGIEYAIAPAPCEESEVDWDYGWYSLPGFNSDSSLLELSLPLKECETHYCFNMGTEYQLWHVDDMKDVSEINNHGIAYTDIYIIQLQNEN